MLQRLKPRAVKDSYVSKYSAIQGGSKFVNSSIDDHSFCGYDCVIQNTAIGKYCSIADNVKIGLSQHPVEWLGTSPVFYRNKDSISLKLALNEKLEVMNTEIGSDVWIGHSAIIKAGVRIGHGSVIASGAVVTRNVQPYAIVGGVPANLIRYRFSSEVIEKLIKIEWWNLSPDYLTTLGVDFKNPEEFLNKI